MRRELYGLTALLAICLPAGCDRDGESETAPIPAMIANGPWQITAIDGDPVNRPDDPVDAAYQALTVLAAAQTVVESAAGPVLIRAGGHDFTLGAVAD